MAKSTKLSHKKIWVAFRHANKSLTVQGFGDVLYAEDGENFSVSEHAEFRAQGYLKANPGAVIVDNAISAEDAIRLATEKGI
jgi:hypothetical protein